MKARAATDELLMTAYVRGDRQAFAVLFARLAPRVHAFFKRSFKDTSTADDLLQTTFLEIHRSRARYDHELPLGPWVFSIAARIRLDELRRHYRRQELVSDEDLDGALDQPSTASERHRRDLVAHVQQALERLPQSQRSVIHLSRFEGMTFAEIAVALGTSEGAIKVRACRAYERLRLLLEPLEEYEVKTA